jgi:hypothetical protein
MPFAEALVDVYSGRLAAVLGHVKKHREPQAYPTTITAIAGAGCSLLTAPRGFTQAGL